MLAIPLFIFAGNLMNNTGITSRLVKLANVLTGHMYGSVGQVSVVLSTLMGGVSGSAVADAAMECRILGPEMTKRGYAPGWAAAVNCLSGLIVATIPPSMGLILYGTVGEVSIGRLFIAGFVPGIIMCILMMAATSWSARHYGYKPDHEKPSSAREIVKACIESIWALMFPILLIVFIRFGVMTPSESGAFAVFYALFVGVFIYKELNLERFKECLVSSVKDLSVTTMILAFSGIFSYGVVFDQLPATLTNILIDRDQQQVSADPADHPDAGDLRNVHGDDRYHADLYADSGAAGSAVRHRPGTLRYHHDDRGNHGLLHAACGRRPLHLLEHHELFGGGDDEILHSVLRGDWTDPGCVHFHPAGSAVPAELRVRRRGNLIFNK